MTPQELNKLLENILEYPIVLWMFGWSVLNRVWHWFNGKKTVIGGMFFVVSDYLIIPIVTHYNGEVPADLEFWLKTVASFFVLIGATHKGIKRHENKLNK